MTCIVVHLALLNKLADKWGSNTWIIWCVRGDDMSTYLLENEDISKRVDQPFSGWLNQILGGLD